MRLPFLASMLLLAACSGGGGDDDNAGFCAPVGGQFAGDCNGCTIESGALAADGSLGSAATVVLSPSAEARLQATGAQLGAHVAGVLFDLPAGITSLQLQINTYRDGVAQDTGTAYVQTGASNVCTNCSFLGDGRQYAGIDVSEPFDSIEVLLTSSSAAVETPFPVYELCGR